ncbi:MAG: restriction endonuclease subunit S [Bacteroidota bacterium]
MMMKYDYKDSGIEWIGRIPNHWKVDKLKRLLSEKLKYGAIESGDLDNPEHPRYIRITDFDDNGSLREDTFKSLPPEVAKEYLLNEGDVLFARSGATVGKTFLFTSFKGVACFAGYLIKATTLKYKLLPEFLFFYTKSYAYEDWKNGIFTQATIQNIGADKYQYLNLPVPPISEQASIAKYLAKTCSEIDQVIAIKKKQISTIQLQLKSTIFNSITKGLGPNTQLKETGEVWLNKIPVHWKFDRLKDLVELRTDKTDEKSEDIDYIELEDIEKETGSVLNFRNTLEVAGKVTLFYEGDVLFCKLRPYLVKHHLALNNGKCTGEILVYNCTKILNRYFQYCISSHGFIQKCTAISYGAKMPRVDPTKQLAYFVLPLPPRKEQVEICDFLDEIKIKTYDLTKKIEIQIETLQQFKKSLIQEVITGKKQVYGLT